MIFTTLNADSIISIIGYLGSAFVLGSFLLKDIKWIRIVNIFGAIFFVIYGISTETWATAYMNLALVIVHIVYLIKMYRNKSKEQIEE
jgi:hypothetical protein